MRKLQFVLVVVTIAALAAARPSAQRMVTQDVGVGDATTVRSMFGGPSNAPPIPHGTGLIYGQALEGDGQRPVAGALVTLGLQGSAPVRVLADGEGRFAFRDVPKGSFGLTAIKPGYADGAYGRLRPSGPTQTIDLADGQQFTGANVQLWKLASISGVVLDENNDPVVGVTVRALKRTIAGGQRQLATSGPSDTTDDRGMYRIGSLEPGDYVIALPMTQSGTFDFIGPGGLRDLLPAPTGGPAGGSIAIAFSVSGSGGPGGNQAITMQSLEGPTLAPAGMTEDGHLLWYQTLYYPNALAASRATTVALATGDERAGVDFALKPVRAVNVGGTLTGPDGPASGIMVNLFPADAEDIVSPIETASTMTDGAGHFEFTRVPTGQYILRSSRSARLADLGNAARTIMQGPGGSTMVFQTVTRSSTDAVPPLPTEPTLWLEQPVQVGAADIADLNLSLRTGLRVSGRVEFDGAAARPASDQLPSIEINLNPADSRTSGVAGGGRGRVESSGAFTTVGVPPGRYVLQVNAPSGWRVRAASFNGHDISDVPFEIRDGDVEGVTITFTDKTTTLTGAVTTAAGAPDTKAAVIVFPDDSAYWTSSGPSPKRLKNVRSGANGAYSATLPPGDYLVVAVRDGDAGNWNDPRVLEALSHVASRVSIAEGDKKVQALRTVAMPKLDGGL